MVKNLYVLTREKDKQPLKLKYIENNYYEYQNIIRGNMKVTTVRDDILCIYDSEGLSKLLPSNLFEKQVGMICGTVIFCSIDNELPVSINVEQMQYLMNYLQCGIVIE